MKVIIKEKKRKIGIYILSNYKIVYSKKNELDKIYYVMTMIRPK